MRLLNWFSGNTEMNRLLILSSLFSVLLVLLRAMLTGQWLFVFLPWNLFLAAVPYFTSGFLQNNPGWVENKWRFGLLFTTWLLFIPNSFYILTDLFHLQLREESNRWFDLTLIFSFAWNGLLLGVLSVRHMEKVVVHCLGIRNTLLFLLPVMWLSAFGVYIGRFLRFNSWDIVSNPVQLVNEILYMIIHPFRHFNEWAMISCFAVSMTLLYLSIQKIAGMLRT